MTSVLLGEFLLISSVIYEALAYSLFHPWWVPLQYSESSPFFAFCWFRYGSPPFRLAWPYFSAAIPSPKSHPSLSVPVGWLYLVIHLHLSLSLFYRFIRLFAENLWFGLYLPEW